MNRLKLYRLPPVYLLLGFIVMACANHSPKTAKKEPVNTLFGKTSEALFRGHQMGDTVTSILSSEPGTPTVDTDSLLQYHYFYNLESDSTQLDLFFNIDSYGLFEIQADIHPKSKDGAKDLMLKITDILNEQFGDFKRMGIVRRWTTNSPSNNIIEITLSNETEDSGEPFVSLNYLEPLPDEL